MKKLIFLPVCLSICLNSSLSQSIPNYVPSNGLIGWWPFTNNAKDSSGNGNNGTVNGATLTSDRFGNSNSAYTFTNSTDNITLTNVVETNLLKYSVTGWFKKSSSSINTEGTIFCANNPCNAPGGLRFAIGGNNKACFGAEFQSCSSVWSYSQNQNYADGKWHFFAAIFDGVSGFIDSNHLKIYIDNVFIPQYKVVQGNTNNVFAPINNQNLPTIIGNVTGNGDNFQGQIDDIGIWNRVLTTNEIRDLYNSQINSISILKSVFAVIVSPNPANKLVNISINNILIGSNYFIYDLEGKVVTNGILKNTLTIINTEKLHNGLYFVRIGESNLLTQKFSIVSE